MNTSRDSSSSDGPCTGPAESSSAGVRATAWLAGLSLPVVFFHEMGLPLAVFLGRAGAGAVDRGLSLLLALTGLGLMFLVRRPVFTPLGVLLALTAGASAFNWLFEALAGGPLIPLMQQPNPLPWAGGLAAGVVVLLVLMFRQDLSAEDFGLRPAPAGWQTPAMLTGLIVFALIMLWRFIGTPGPMVPALPTESAAEFLLTVALFPVLSAAVYELHFRGLLQSAFETALSTEAALVLQALLFAALFVQGFPGGIGGVAGAFAFGLAAGALRKTSGSLLGPLLMHWAAAILLVTFGWDRFAG